LGLILLQGAQIGTGGGEPLTPRTLTTACGYTQKLKTTGHVEAQSTSNLVHYCKL